MNHPSPFAFTPHPLGWAVVLAAAAAYGFVVRRPERRATPRQVATFFGGLVLLLVALTWPLADLAAHWSLTALVVQRLVLMLAVPPLLLLGLPHQVVAALTRPAPVDAVIRAVSRPVVAVVIVTVAAVATLTTAAVDAQASSAAARVGLDVVLVAAGFVLWAPVLSLIPGSSRPSALGRAAYLIVQSIVPSFLAIVWIFARHPLYPALARTAPIAGVSPLLDQQLAGFVAKFGTIAALWTVAFVVLTRAQHTVATGGDPDPLTWADVERHLQRAERAERRSRSAWLPPVAADPPKGIPDRPAPGDSGNGEHGHPEHDDRPGPPPGASGPEGTTPG